MPDGCPISGSTALRSLADGHDTFIEVGPKRALTGMMRELAPGRTALAVATPAAIQELSLPA